MFLALSPTYPTLPEFRAASTVLVAKLRGETQDRVTVTKAAWIVVGYAAAHGCTATPLEHDVGMAYPEAAALMEHAAKGIAGPVDERVATVALRLLEQRANDG